MGVTVLYPYQITDHKLGPHAIDFLHKRILAQGAVHSGQFLVDCETYISDPRNGPSKAVHVLHNSEYPTTTFSILDNGTNKIPLVADNLFDLLMLKMTSVFSSKKPTKIESKGTRFEFGDFIIKIGSVTLMENFKGVLIEIEYQPCFVLSYCWEMIREMLSGVLDTAVPAKYPAYFSPQSVPNALGQQTAHSRHNDTYEPIDTIHQYLEFFTNYRKQSSVAHGATSNMHLSSNIRS